MPFNSLIICHPLLLRPLSFPASGFFKWVSSSHQVAKVLEFQLQHQSFQWIFRTDSLLDWLVWSPCCPYCKKILLLKNSDEAFFKSRITLDEKHGNQAPNCYNKALSNNENIQNYIDWPIGWFKEDKRITYQWCHQRWFCAGEKLGGMISKKGGQVHWN